MRSLYHAFMLRLAFAATALLPACHAASSSALRKPTEPQVIFTATGKSLSIQVELARTEEETMRGLMFRSKLEPGRGMLFIFPSDRTSGFWMKNTYIPLDMVFIDESHRVIYIEANAVPLTTVERKPHSAYRYVLEVPGGYCQAQGITIGMTANFAEVE